jgi:two-component system CheB/CheR fusion protein
MAGPAASAARLPRPSVTPMDSSEERRAAAPAANDAGTRADAHARIEPGPDQAEESLAERTDDAVPSRGFAMQPVVGLGGSAGAIAALQAFFAATPGDTGLAFVVVMHLAADHESMLAQILQRSTSMAVRQVVEAMRLEPDHVYIVPPGKAVASLDGQLSCVDLTPERGRRVTVDLFFRTLADTHGPNAVAIVLSGADGDGAIGIKRIKERGGLTIVQDPDEAEHSGMPRAAIATGMIDWVLSVADMPARLGNYSALVGRLKLPPEDGPPPTEPSERAGDDLEAALRELLAYVRAQTGRDFSDYKRSTILRRIARRMSVNGIEALPGYLSFMRTHRGEAGALLKDLLISVTNFFRDRDAFDALALQIPALFAGKSSGDELRVWVPACASGEEAYSISILLAEHARTLDAPPSLQIFATDLDEDAIRQARDGVYPAAIGADVSEERLRRFFTKDHRGYRVRSEVRETVLFAIHDLLKDAPFSRLDLFSCRNLLIYLSNDAQRRALEIAHFALRGGGRLFLGASETIDGCEHLFQNVDKKQRLYEPRRVGRQRLPAPSAQGTLARALELQERSREAHPLPPGLGLPHRFMTGALRPSASDAGVGSWRELHLKLIERFAPPSIVVTDEGDIVHLSERAGRFLRYSAGEPTTSLLSVLDPALTVDLRSALVRAKETRAVVETEPLPFAVEGAAATVVVRVAPADDLAPGFLLVTFELRPAPAEGVVAVVAPDDTTRRLQRQVDELKWHLRDLTEQGNAATQELKAGNEELQAMNEELRSATEELETSREELQSINEELTTVNVELKGKVEELARANGDLHNLMASTAIATVFLDRSLCIRMFTPSAVELFNLIESDVGRPLADLAGRLEYGPIIDDARAVMERLVPIEREVRFGERWLLARLLPYRDSEDPSSGVVLTFLDITVRRNAEDALRESETHFRTIVSQAAAGIVHTDLQGRITLVNARFAQIVGRRAESLDGMSVFDLVVPEAREHDAEVFRHMVETGGPFEAEKGYLRPDGSIVWVSAAVTTTLDAAGSATAVIGIVLDISQSKRSQQALAESEERLRLVVENAREYAIVSMDLERRVQSWNIGARELTGYAEDEVLGRAADIIFIEQDRADGAAERESRQALADGRAADERWHRRKDGSRFWGSGVMMAMRAKATDEPVGLVKIFRDQTYVRSAAVALETSRAELVQALVDNRRARAEAEAASHAKDRFLAILSHELRTPLTPVVMALYALERNVDLPHSVRSTVELIRRNVKAELTLIDDLLDVTRISSGKLEMSREQTDMHEVVRAAAAVCETDFSAKRQRLGLSLKAPRHVVPGDAARLQQVVWNLLKNASKFTANEGEVQVATSNIQDTFVLIVADNGMGISGEALALIFDAFAQEGQWVTSEFGGLGLGLAIAKATVDAHHGTLTAASGGRDQGATFTMTLPLG